MGLWLKNNINHCNTQLKDLVYLEEKEARVIWASFLISNNFDLLYIVTSLIMTKISIERSSEFLNWIRDYQIYIDGKKVGTIENGGSKDFEVEEGNHTVEARIDWCGSPKVAVAIENGETKTLTVGGFKHAKWLFVLLIGIIVISFTLNSKFDSEYITYAIWVPLFIILYYVTFGRNNYLSLKTEKE